MAFHDRIRTPRDPKASRVSEGIAGTTRAVTEAALSAGGGQGESVGTIARMTGTYLLERQIARRKACGR